jgi:hypothetical protein
MCSAVFASSFKQLWETWGAAKLIRGNNDPSERQAAGLMALFSGIPLRAAPRKRLALLS